VLALYLERGTLRSESSGAVISPAAIGRVIFSLILRRLEVAAISSSAHADQVCGGQTPLFSPREVVWPPDGFAERNEAATCLCSLASNHVGNRAIGDTLVPGTIRNICGLPWPKGNTDIPIRLRL